MIPVTLRRIGLLLLAGGVMAGVGNTVHPRRIPWVQRWSDGVEARAAKQQIDVVSLAVAWNLHRTGAVQFVDARSAEAYAEAHVIGAISLPLQAIDAHPERWATLVDSARPLLVYCGDRTCDDALLLALELRASGAREVRLLADGFTIWQGYGGAVAP